MRYRRAWRAYAINHGMTERPVAPPVSSRKKAEPADRPRINGTRAIADLMPDIGRAAFRKFGFVQSSVVTRWAEIVGRTYADVSVPESIRFPAGQKSGGTLSLTVSSGYAPMMQHVLPEIVERVNRFFGYAAVAKVTMRQGEVTPLQPERAPPPRNLKPVPVELGDSLRDIGDPELRAVLESLAQGLANSSGLPKIG
jgi:hypothetical protein